jgi:thymidylate synthase (FAD)
MNPIFKSDSEVDLIHHVGTDADVVRAARVSVHGRERIDTGEIIRQKATLEGREQLRSVPPGRSDDVEPTAVKGLIDHMIRNRHGSVFEHSMFTFRIYAPIFVHREFMTHRHISKNTESARYHELEPVFWMPGKSRKLRQVGKPSAYELVEAEPGQHERTWERMGRAYTTAFTEYQGMLNDGIAREVARAVLPVATYTSFYATCNARSLMHFLSLRIDHHANAVKSHPQHEIQDVAVQMGDFFREKMPATAWSWHVNGRIAP